MPTPDAAQPSETEQAWPRILAFLDLGRPAQAAAETLRALSHDPEDASLWRVLSQIYTLLDEYPQALEAAQRSVGLAPDSSGAHLSLGTAIWNVRVRGKVFWSGAGQAAQTALAAINEALRLEPGSTEAMLTLANLHLLMGKPRLAQPLIMTALKAEPHHQIAQLYLAEAWLQQKKLVLAEQQLRKLLADDPNFAPALHLLSRVSLRRGRAEEAFTAALAVIRLEPADAGAQAHFKMLVQDYLPFPTSALRFVVLPHIIVIVPFMALGIWLRNLYRVRQLSPHTRTQIRRVRGSAVNWRSPFVLYLALCIVIFALVFALPHLPASIRPGANGAVGWLILALFFVGLLWLIVSGVRVVYRWLRSRR